MRRFLITSNLARSVSKREFSNAVKFETLGEPSVVLKYGLNDPLPTIGPKDVAVKFLAAPINPSDLNMAQGVYGIKAALPAIGGNEGVAVVTEAGAQSSLKPGDWVIPTVAGFGTWRQHAVGPEETFTKIANDIPVPYAATITVNPCTAYRLLRDFEELRPGDVVIQNGANSMVGLAVIQMARERGIRTINIVREDRPEAEKVVEMLTNLGGDINVLDSYTRTAGFREIIADLPPIRLGLNTVGGEYATELARSLAPGASFVTYGGMSKKPLTLPLDLIASRRLKVRGFWMAKWNELHSAAERQTMLDEVAALIRDDKLAFFFEMHDFDDFDYALAKATEPYRLRKVVLNLDYPDRFAEHDARPIADYEHFKFPV